MNCCVRRQVEVGGSYEPLGVAGLILIDRNIPDLGPMLQKDFDHVQRAALTVGRRAILQRLVSDAIDDAVVAIRHLEKHTIKDTMVGVVIAVRRHGVPSFRQAATHAPTLAPYRTAVSPSRCEVTPRLSIPIVRLFTGRS